MKIKNKVSFEYWAKLTDMLMMLNRKTNLKYTDRITALTEKCLHKTMYAHAVFNEIENVEAMENE